MSAPRYEVRSLIQFAEAMFSAAGLASDHSAVAAPLLVEADLMGHDTHGLQQLGAYVDALRDGTMTARGEPEILSDLPAVAVWDGNWLNGIWLTARALEHASERARKHGIGVVVIRRSHHIASLQTYLTRATSRGLMALIACSDPSVRVVAPFGGVDPVFSPDPIAVGIPTSGDPILIDMSASITTIGMSGRKAAAGERLRGKWLQDSAGVATDDPAVLQASPPGTLLPTGGQDHGHKGYGIALMIEALTQGLAGYGRASAEKRWSASVYLQVIDPALFAGTDAFDAQVDHMVRLCHGSRPYPGLEAVRLPGEAALRRRRRALSEGVELFPGTIERLAERAKALDVRLPTPH